MTEDETVFEDARDTLAAGVEEPDLESQLREVQLLLTKALNNRFQEALETCQRW